MLTAHSCFQLTGKAGDAFFAHPFMPHSKSRNHLRRFRAITNPTSTLLEPFNYHRADPSDYSLLEEYTLNVLGAWPQGLPDWHILPVRRRFQPHTQAGRDSKVAKELERMQAHAAKTGEPVDSMYLTGAKFEGDGLKKYPPPDRSFFAETMKPVPAVQAN